MTLCRRCNERQPESRGLCHRCYLFTRTRQVAYGRWESMYVDAEPARQHVLAMRAAGIGRRRLAELSGVPGTTICDLIVGRPHRGHPPRAQILRRSADALLAVPVPEVPVDVVAESTPVCAVGATRRLQALVAGGYQLDDLTTRLGMSRSSVSRLTKGDTSAKASTVRAVRELFAQLQLTPGPSDLARTHGARLGWPLPFDWDEDDIDDPAVQVQRSTTQPGTHRATQVAQISDRRAQVARLTAKQLTAREIAERLGVDARTVERDRALHASSAVAS